LIPGANMSGRLDTPSIITEVFTMDQAYFHIATMDDLPQVVALLASLNGPEEPAMPLNRAAEIFRRIATYPDYSIWLLSGPQGLLGTYSLMIMDNLGHGGAPEAIVENVAVSSVHRSQGAGTRMMRHAMDQARQRGCYKLVLSSNIARERAHAFYDRLGFSRHGISFQVQLAASASA